MGRYSALSLRIDNSGGSVITCDISNNWGCFSVSVDINSILVIFRIRKLCI